MMKAISALSPQYSFNPVSDRFVEDIKRGCRDYLLQADFWIEKQENIYAGYMNAYFRIRRKSVLGDSPSANPRANPRVNLFQDYR
jgi:hypothetical protein